MRRGPGVRLEVLSLGVTVAVFSAALPASAQPPAHPQPTGTAFQNHHDPAADAISVGRTRMAKGDYAGALEAFDAALRTSIDPTVRRDRGLCHEQLGHPFPAMDDMRAYLTALPDAPDADDIRGRLNQLETANGLGGTGTGAAVPAGQPAASSSSSSKGEDPFAVDANDPNAKSNGNEAVPGSGNNGRAGNYDQELALNDEWDQAEGSPMRRGKGLSFGVYGRGYGASTGGVSGYGVGATIRGALGPVSTLYGEVGYVTYNAGSDEATGQRNGGLSLGFGYEVRLRLDQFASNAIILAATASYERVTQSNVAGLPVINIFDPRFKLGYRHVFGPGFGIELGGEVAEPIAFAGNPSGAAANFTTFGGTLALIVGF
jgi:hypothetical protein